MTIRAILGLFVLNAGFSPGGDERHLGDPRHRPAHRACPVGRPCLSHGPLPVASCWVLELVIGIPFGLPAICGTAVVLGATAIVIGRRLGRTIPARAEGPIHLAVVTAVGIAMLRALSGGALSVGAPARALRLRRLGLLDPEGQGALLLSRARRAALHIAPGPDVPAARPRARCVRVLRDGRGRHGHASPPVLVCRGRVRRRDCGAPRREGETVGAVASARAGRRPAPSFGSISCNPRPTSRCKRW